MHGAACQQFRSGRIYDLPSALSSIFLIAHEAVGAGRWRGLRPFICRGSGRIHCSQRLAEIAYWCNWFGYDSGGDVRI